ncbi:hypothetical protein Kpol_1030p41 [Vanderwaltozyma polyspora DSM 70294]|uniref:RRM domain-containing protein n=1 Tax=Vanderwaltozyma polyspora (strain ATCC 22028 / DSM 70294 / BCRC 21397 / CBS 2163 / NBRC 10782 / NRRL Y-8283 / UCD 57-17) TaxID=436907 RepID=A7TMV9_VANPO|nr:uncharacterized protein Kpol_1030p41 [Vanderwaltozyma polyspora DSM 70294]EDO16431.1 hypothetical protein Kpol_1030p41 [Vanderwaltozyma polyspora DSM 70294]
MSQLESNVSEVPENINDNEINIEVSGDKSNVQNDRYNQQQQEGSENDELENQETADDDEVIPTAIVIKNIPFAIKKEQLLEFIENLGLPLPYAFNYHFDNGVFRGLAFANFQTTEETTKVIDLLNGEEIGGRKLRVEYKKMLPQVERERIEREKREKRGQLEEQHNLNQVASNLSLHSLSRTTLNNMNNNSSFFNNNVNSASSSQLFSVFVNGNTSNITQKPPATQQYLSAQNTNSSLYGQQNSTTERYYPPLPSSTILPLPPQQLDFNDPDTLEIYSQLLLFKDRERIYYELVYPLGLSANHKRIINVLCSFLGLVATYDSSFIVIRRKTLDQTNLQSHLQQTGQNDQISSSHPLQPSSTGGSMNKSQSYTSLLQAHAAATAANNNLINGGSMISNATNQNHNYMASPTMSGMNLGFNANSNIGSQKLPGQPPISMQQQQSTLQNVDQSHQQQPFIRQQNLSSSSRIPSGYSSNNLQLKQVNPLLRNPGISPPTNQVQPNTNQQRIQSSFYNNSTLSGSATALSSQFLDQQVQQPFQQLMPQNTNGSVHSNFSMHSFYEDGLQQNVSPTNMNATELLNSVNANNLDGNFEEGLTRSLSGLDL